MAESPAPPQVDDNALLAKDDQPGPDSKPKLAELSESRTELLSRVQSLRKDLQDWRGRLDTQVKAYRQELGDLRSTLNTEVEQLRTEFQDLRSALKKQLDATSGLATKAPELPKFPTDACGYGQQWQSPPTKFPGVLGPNFTSDVYLIWTDCPGSSCNPPARIDGFRSLLHPQAGLEMQHRANTQEYRKSERPAQRRLVKI